MNVANVICRGVNMFKKFPDAVRIPIFTSEIICYPKMPTDEVLAQWRQQLEKMKDTTFIFPYKLVEDLLEALPQQRKLLPKHHGDIVAEMLKDERNMKVRRNRNV